MYLYLADKITHLAQVCWVLICSSSFDPLSSSSASLSVSCSLQLSWNTVLDSAHYLLRGYAAIVLISSIEHLEALNSVLKV